MMLIEQDTQTAIALLPLRIPFENSIEDELTPSRRCDSVANSLQLSFPCN